MKAKENLIFFIVLAIALFRISLCAPAKNIDIESEFPYHSILDENGNFQLFWKFDNESITFYYFVVSKGWSGLGFSPNGGMGGADMVVMGFDQSGNAFLSDRHADENGYPPEDKQQDYNLINDYKNETHLVFKFYRKRNTCDPEDWSLTTDTTNVIFAMSDAIPQSKDNITQHSFRSTKSVHFFDKSPIPELGPPKEPNAIYLDLTVNKLKLPEDQDTLYWCEIIKFTKPTADVEYIKIDPIIQAENVDVIHHLVAYACPGDMSKYVGHGINCFDKAFEIYGVCQTFFLAGWAKGGQSIELPEDVGLLFPHAHANDIYIMLETHYNNPEHKKGKIDSSGLRLWLTKNPRPIKGSQATFGVTPLDPSKQIIPPGSKEFTSYGYCNSECTNGFPESGIKILGGILHTHLAGRKVRLQHIRNGKQLPPVFDDEHFDFNYQDYREKREHTVVLPGDQLVTECVYETMNRNMTTFGGPSTTNEMCLVFAFVYPAIYRAYMCMSAVASNSNALKRLNITDKNDLTEFHWTFENIIGFQNATRNDQHEMICIRQSLDPQNATNDEVFMQNGYPIITEPWTRHDECTIANTTNSLVKKTS